MKTAARLAAIHGAAVGASADRGWSEAEYAQLLAAPGTSVALSGNDGFALLRVAADEAEILMIAVHPERRRCGIGAKLLDEALARAFAAGARRVVLEVARDNLPALTLYRRRGFREIASRRRYYARAGGEAADASVMAFGPSADAIMTPSLQSAYSRRAEDRSRGPVMTSRIERICESKGLRMTDQRRVIAQVLSDADDHPDVEQLYQRASKVDPRISIATVYRTVRLFEEANILTKHDFGDGRARYEEASEDHHDHLIDTRSGRVIEFQNDAIERLQEQVARELGYRLVGHRLELYGVPLRQQPTDGNTE